LEMETRREVKMSKYRKSRSHVCSQDEKHTPKHCQLLS
jgi:hypothetical protein